MFIGHGLLAFALVSVGALLWGTSPRRALHIGVLAALFATLPDLDMAYAPIGFVMAFDGLATIDEAFWSSANVAHRGVTHALPVALAATVGFTVARYRGFEHPTTIVAGVGLGSLVLAIGLLSGPLAGVIAGLFVVGGLAIVVFGAYLGLPTAAIGIAAGVGFITHPFGDFFTGSPPALWYPFDGPALETIILHADPTVHLLGAFFIELAVIWLAVIVLAVLCGYPLWPAIKPRAGLGAGYAAMVFVIPAPTLDVPTPFVVSVLAVAMLAVPLRWRGRVPLFWRVPVTALAAVTVAAVGFTLAYLVV